MVNEARNLNKRHAAVIDLFWLNVATATSNCMKRKCQRRVWFRYLKSLFETFSDLSRFNAEVLHS